MSNDLPYTGFDRMLFFSDVNVAFVVLTICVLNMDVYFDLETNSISR